MYICPIYLIYALLRQPQMDLRLVNGAVFQVVGPSGSGKTHFVVNLLSQNVFKESTKQIYWLMGVVSINILSIRNWQMISAQQNNRL